RPLSHMAIATWPICSPMAVTRAAASTGSRRRPVPQSGKTRRPSRPSTRKCQLMQRRPRMLPPRARTPLRRRSRQLARTATTVTKSTAADGGILLLKGLLTHLSDYSQSERPRRESRGLLLGTLLADATLAIASGAGRRASPDRRDATIL